MVVSLLLYVFSIISEKGIDEATQGISACVLLGSKFGLGIWYFNIVSSKVVT